MFTGEDLVDLYLDTNIAVASDNTGINHDQELVKDITWQLAGAVLGQDQAKIKFCRKRCICLACGRIFPASTFFFAAGRLIN